MVKKRFIIDHLEKNINHSAPEFWKNYLKASTGSYNHTSPASLKKTTNRSLRLLVVQYYQSAKFKGYSASTKPS